jgi:hypothetical protein
MEAKSLSASMGQGSIVSILMRRRVAVPRQDEARMPLGPQGAGQRTLSPHGMCELSDSPLFVDAPRRATSVDRKR